MFLHTKKYFPYLLEKKVSTYQTQEVVIKAICLSFPSSETALAFFLETALMPEGYRKPRDLKTMTAFGFGLYSFPSVLSYSLSHVNRSLGLFKEASQGPALGPQSPWKQVPLLRLPLFRTRGSLACCSEAILSLLIFRLFSLSLLSALKLDFERSRLSLVQNPQIPKTMLSIPVRSS